MPLSGQRIQQIQESLFDAYDEAALRRMLRVQMDVNLDHVAGGDNLTEVVFNLIGWAKRTGNVQRLIDGAIAGNPGNNLVQALVKDAGALPGSSPAKPPGSEGAPRNRSGGDTFHVHIGDNAHNVVVGKDIVQQVHESSADAEDTTSADRRFAELAYLDDLIQRYQF